MTTMTVSVRTDDTNHEDDGDVDDSDDDLDDVVTMTMTTTMTTTMTLDTHLSDQPLLDLVLEVEGDVQRSEETRFVVLVVHHEVCLFRPFMQCWVNKDNRLADTLTNG